MRTTQRPCLHVLIGPDLGQPVKAGASRHRCAAYGLDRLSPARQRLPMQVRMIGSAKHSNADEETAKGGYGTP
ncbi:MAG: hypothetical protein B7Z78_07170 [Rhodospirillales bacterium 20-60-12]|nr:MAG: hypothetical protein B7Z78_07170 [Rhodospirillales bacterium 20-60-12]